MNLARRYLKQISSLDRYSPITRSDLDFEIALELGDSLGKYTNSNESAVIILENGLIIDRFTVVYYQDIVEVMAVSSKSESVIQCKLKDESVVIFHIDGQKEQFRDISNFLRFLRNVLSNVVI